MARPRNRIPRYISIDVQELGVIVASMGDNGKFGDWMEKAVHDWQSGCVAPDVDPYVKSQYDASYTKMLNTQRIQGNKYLHRKAEKPASAENVPATAKTQPSQTSTPNHAAVAGKKSKKTAVVAEERKAYGEYKHVLLTVEDGEKLREEYGENLELAIEFVDNYCESSGARYKNYRAVMKKNGWVWNRVQETLRKRKQAEGMKSFREQDIERKAAWLRGDSVNHETRVNDADMSAEELEAVYGRAAVNG